MTDRDGEYAFNLETVDSDSADGGEVPHRKLCKRCIKNKSACNAEDPYPDKCSNCEENNESCEWDGSFTQNPAVQSDLEQDSFPNGKRHSEDDLVTAQLPSDRQPTIDHESDEPEPFNDAVDIISIQISNSPNPPTMPRIKQISVLHQGTIFGLHVSYGLSDGTVFERKHGEPIISVNNIVHDCICLTETESLCEVSGLASDGIIWQLGFVTLDEQTGVKRSCGPYGKGRPFGSWPNLLRFRTTGCVIAFGGICTPYMLTGLSCITAGTPPSMEVEDVDEGGPESS